MKVLSKVLSVVLGILLLYGPAVAQQRVEAVGTAFSRLDSLPLPNVRVTLLPAGLTTSTNASGRFRVEGFDRRRASRVAFARPGFLPDTIVLGNRANGLIVYLEPAPVEFDPIAVNVLPTDYEEFLSEVGGSSVELDVVDIERAPALLEADVLRGIQMLPGTVSKNDYSVGFNVRGGETDQNLIQLDGVTVFNPSHLGGLFSTFDVAAVDRVEFIAGGFPAGYPGRLSSVVDIDVRSGNRTRTNLRGQVSLLSSKLLVEGPLPGGRGSYLLGGRRSYADAVVNTVSSETLPYYFGDLLGKISVPFRTGASLSVTGYWGGDVLDLELIEPIGDDPGVTLDFEWGNRLVGANANHVINDFEFRHHLSVSEFNTLLGLLPGLIRYDNSARVISANSKVTYHPEPTLDHTMGVSLEGYDMRFRLESPDAEVVVADQGYRPTIASLFVDEVARLFSWLSVEAGLRADVGFRSADFTTWSPRASVKLFIDRSTAVTGSAGRYHQAIHSLRDQEQPITIFEFWVGADSVIPVARADHLVLGFERWFGRDVSVSIEGYRKRYTNLLTVNRLQDIDVVGDEFVATTGDSYGFDLLLQRHVGNWTGWLAYSFAKSERVIPGVSFPPSHDRRHTLNLVVNSPGPLGSSMSTRLAYGSPLPYTGFVGEWSHRRYSSISNQFVTESTEPIGSTLNGARYPAYSRLDVSFRWVVESWGGQLRPYLNLVNVFNRQNVFLYFFDFTDSPVSRTGLSQLPLIPTFGVEFEW